MKKKRSAFRKGVEDGYKDNLRGRKARFIRTLAEFLAGNQAGKSIELEMEVRSPRPEPLTSWAKEWGKLRGASSLCGYPTVDEAEKTLTEFLK